MGFSDKESKSEQKQEQNAPDRGNAAYGSPAFGMPNSLMADLMSDGDGGNFSGASVIQRQMLPIGQIPSAEAEADRLSAGVRGNTPNEIRREMENRLNADFSNVRFHSGTASESRAAQLDARAYTRGRDVYFGKGGFEPGVAAHELVHTVQQGAAKGSVSLSVSSGTIQRFWIFGKKKSNYEKDVEPTDIADSLFRIQAGMTASDERIQEERDAAYTKTYNREMKRFNRNNGNGIDEDNTDAERLARNAAGRSASSLRVNRKDYVSRSDRESYNAKIRSINKDTYRELLARRQEAADELCNYFDGISSRSLDSVDKNMYTAANSPAGRNFKLYNQLVQKIERVHENAVDGIFERWKNDLQKMDRVKRENLAQANTIITRGTSRDNNYLKTGEGIQQRAKASHDNKEYYKDLYAKKKTRIDRMAAVYRRNKQIEEGRKSLKIDGLDEIEDESQSDLISKNKPQNDIISVSGMKEDDNDISFEGIPKINLIDDPKKGKKKSKNIISTGSKKERENIITTNFREDEEDEKDENSDVENGAVKQKVIEYISNADQPQGMDENSESDLTGGDDIDPNMIIRSGVPFKDELSSSDDEYVAPSPALTKVKDQKGKTDFIKNIVKTEAGLIPLGLMAIDQNDLNHPIYQRFISPALSGVGGAIGGATGLVGTATGALDTIRNIKNVKSGGSHFDYINSGLDTAGSAATMTAGTLSALQSAGNIPKIGGTLANIGSFGGDNMIPGLSIATGGASLLAGGIEGYHGQKSINTIDSQITALKKKKPLSKDQAENQNKLMKIFNQGRKVAELHRTGGILKGVGGGIALGTGIALLSGPLAPITAAVLGITGSVSGLVSFFYGRKKKSKIRKAVTGEELGIDWEKEKARVRKQFKGEKLSNDEVKEIIIKGHGYNAKTRKQVFKQINMDRAKMLLDLAKGEGPLHGLADKVIGALGVSRKKGRYAAGAQKLIAEKLGGG